MQLAKQTEVIKASPAIQIQSKITLLQRRAWNVLLAHAYHDLPIKESHTIGVAELAERLGFQDRNANHKYLKDALRALRACEVEWNVLRKDKTTTWGVAGLFAEVQIDKNICSYRYPAALRMKLYNPHIYTRLNLQLQNQFTSRYALALWEICFDYFDVRREQGETPMIDLDAFRKLMGLEPQEYQLFKELNRNVIKPALKEINKVTHYNVNVEQRRVGRRIGALKFRITRVQARPVQEAFLSDLDGLPPIAVALVRADVDRKVALKIAKQEWTFVNPEKLPDPGMYPDFLTYITEKVEMSMYALGVKNRPGYIVEAIRGNYQDKAVARGRKQLAKRVKEKQLEALASEYNTRRDLILHNFIESRPHLVYTVADKIQTEFVLERLRDYPSPAEAYAHNSVFKAEVHSIVETEFCADLVAALYQEYENKKASLEEKMRGAAKSKPQKGKPQKGSQSVSIRQVLDSVMTDSHQQNAR